MEVDYYSKYLKYKSKYLELKKQMGRSKCSGWVTKSECKYCDKDFRKCESPCKENNFEQCKCTKFNQIDTINEPNTCTCGHYCYLHENIYADNNNDTN